MFNNERRVYITGTGSGLGLSMYNILKLKNIEVNRHIHHYLNEDNKIPNIVYGDITKKEVRENILSHFISTNSNVFINNIGVYKNKNFLEYNDDEISDMINVNLTSNILLTKDILKYLVANNNGMIYNINSIAGVKGSAYETIYSATKFGLKGFTESLIFEHQDNKNIRIINVTLGAFKSKMTQDRENYNLLSEPDEVASKIISHILEDYKTINTDLTIYRK